MRQRQVPGADTGATRGAASTTSTSNKHKDRMPCCRSLFVYVLGALVLLAGGVAIGSTVAWFMQDPELLRSAKSRDDRSPLVTAVMTSSSLKVKTLVKKIDVDVNEVYRNLTVLQWALSTQQQAIAQFDESTAANKKMGESAAIVELLLQSPVLNVAQQCPVVYAVHFRLLRAVELLLSKMARSDIQRCLAEQDARGQNVLHVASQSRAAGLASFWLKYAPGPLPPMLRDSLQLRGYPNLTALSENHVAGSFNDFSDIVTPDELAILLEDGQKAGLRQDWLNAQDRTGATPLILACRHGNLGAAQLLLEQEDVDLLATDHAAMTCGHRAAVAGHRRVLADWLDALGARRVDSAQVRDSIAAAACNAGVFSLVQDVLPGSVCKPTSVTPQQKLLDALQAELPAVNGGWGSTVQQLPEWLTSLVAKWDNAQLGIRVEPASVSPDAVSRDYIELSRPVLIQGGVANWTATKMWTRQNVVATLGHHNVTVGIIPYPKQYGVRHYTMPLAQFIAESVPQHSNWTDFERPPRYLFGNQGIPTADIMQAAPLPPVAAQFSDPSLVQWYVGGPMTGAPAHFHGAAWNGMSWGLKLWVLQPPTNGIFTRQHPAHWLEQSVANVSLAAGEAIIAVQRPGDLLYVPPFYSHAVLNLASNVGMVYEF